jgi:hypothetical protein
MWQANPRVNLISFSEPKQGAPRVLVEGQSNSEDNSD